MNNNKQQNQKLNQILSLTKSTLNINNKFSNSNPKKILRLEIEKNKNDKSINSSRNNQKNNYFYGELSNDLFFNNNNQKKNDSNFDYVMNLFNKSTRKSKSKISTPMNLSCFNSSKILNNSNNTIINHYYNNKMNNTINNLKSFINKANTTCTNFHNNLFNKSNNYYINNLSININNNYFNSSKWKSKIKNKEYYNTFNQSFRPKSSSIKKKTNSSNSNILNYKLSLTQKNNTTLISNQKKICYKNKNKNKSVNQKTINIKKRNSIINKRNQTHIIRNIKTDLIKNILPNFKEFFTKNIKLSGNHTIKIKKSNRNKINPIPKCHTSFQAKRNLTKDFIKDSKNENNKDIPEYVRKLEEIKKRTKKLCEIYISLINERIEQKNNLFNVLLGQK